MYLQSRKLTRSSGSRSNFLWAWSTKFKACYPKLVKRKQKRATRRTLKWNSNNLRSTLESLRILWFKLSSTPPISEIVSRLFTSPWLPTTILSFSLQSWTTWRRPFGTIIKNNFTKIQSKSFSKSSRTSFSNLMTLRFVSCQSPTKLSSQKYFPSTLQSSIWLRVVLTSVTRTLSILYHMTKTCLLLLRIS